MQRPTSILVISCSLSPDSRSRTLASQAARTLESAGARVNFIDLRDHRLPFCDGEDCDVAITAPLTGAIRAADAVVLAVPIYNFDVSAATKNLVELTGSAWEGKLVGFICSAGGHGSYMSIMSLANSLMLDFRCLVVPRFVYSTYADFQGDELTSPKVRDRLETLCRETLRLAGALRTESP